MIDMIQKECKCNKCKYKWISKVESPKSCPRCKTRLDYNISIKKTKN